MVTSKAEGPYVSPEIITTTYIHPHVVAEIWVRTEVARVTMKRKLNTAGMYYESTPLLVGGYYPRAIAIFPTVQRIAPVD